MLDASIRPVLVTRSAHGLHLFMMLGPIAEDVVVFVAHAASRPDVAAIDARQRIRADACPAKHLAPDALAGLDGIAIPCRRARRPAFRRVRPARTRPRAMAPIAVLDL